MKRTLFCLCLGIFLWACNDQAATTTKEPADAAESAPAVDLPYQAAYNSTWTDDVSDADLKMVLQTYKDWETGNMDGLAGALADTITVEMNSGNHFSGPKADIIQRWSTYRDSLSSVRIEMEAWRKMFVPDKKEAHVVVWYNEYDTYKDGHVDSASYHDINSIGNGKVVWYSQYRRPKLSSQ